MVIGLSRPHCSFAPLAALLYTLSGVDGNALAHLSFPGLTALAKVLVPLGTSVHPNLLVAEINSFSQDWSA